MSDPTSAVKPDEVAAAYRNGRSAGLATAAMAASLVAWFNLFGIEKSILAIVLSLLAVKGGTALADATRRSRIALMIAALHTVTIIGLLVAFHEKLIDFIRLLHKLS
jgi:hypothetical protein